MNRLFPALIVASTAFAPVAFVAPAQAASFDCAKASSQFEKAICDNDSLSEKDSTLAVAYATALGGLSEDALAIMRDGQRQWLNMTQRACTEDAEPAKVAYDETGIQCLSNLYDSRIATLENSRMVEGLRFYTADLFAFAPDPDGGDYNKVATKKISTLRLDAQSELAAGFNAFVAEQTDYLASRIAAGPKGEDFDVTSDEAVAIGVHNVNMYVISAELTESWYGHGAAHGNYAVSYMHYLRTENRPLKTSDVFAAQGWEDKLTQMVWEQLERDLGEYLQADSADDIKTQVTSIARWDFSPNGIGINFQPYEVASYADGARTVTISWQSIEDLVTGDASAYGWR